MLGVSEDGHPDPGLRGAALDALRISAPAVKCARIAGLSAALRDGRLAISPDADCPVPDFAGRPQRPVLVSPSRVPKRRLGTPAGRAALLHALCHIEFNAINLALDAVARFAGLPAAYYEDWLQVAVEEAGHFLMLERRLAELGLAYGDLPAHEGLWEAALKTRHDVRARMALVPRMLEARGLDVTPGLQARLREVGDENSAALLAIILRDEVGHVAIGNRWFDHLCRARGEDPAAAFLELCAQHGVRTPQPPLNLAARVTAGFDRRELEHFIVLARAP